MDSHLASVLTSGSLDVQNGSQCAPGSHPVIGSFLDPEERTSADTAPGNLQPHPVATAITLIRKDAPSVNGRKPGEGRDLEPASQETSRQPITVKAGVPVLHSQPIRIKIVVPPRCQRPITNAALSLTKDVPPPHVTQPAVVPPVVSAENPSQIKAADVDSDREFSEEPAAEPFRGQNVSQSKSGGSASAGQLMSQRVLGGTTEPPVRLTSGGTPPEVCALRDAVDAQEQTEPLDLSLPKKREIQWRGGGFPDDPGCETSLIMEVDEFEGDGDRDLVEEDDEEEEEEDGTDALEDRLLSPSFFSTSVFTSISATEDDTENLLLIDDQGIPYTLSPDGLRVPQVEESGRASSAEGEGKTSSRSEDTSASQNLDKALHDRPPPPPPSDTAVSTPGADTLLPDVSQTTEPGVRTAQGANAAPPPSSGEASVPAQPVQILTNPAASAPILLLSSSSSPSPQLSSAPLGLSLPLSFTSTPHGASTPMFLLLSSVHSSPSDSACKSKPLTAVDPPSGQAVSTSVSLPATSVQVSTLPPLLPPRSHPVIRLRARDPPVVLSGVSHATSASVLTSLAVPLSSTPAAQMEHRGRTGALDGRSSSSQSTPGREAIPAGEKLSHDDDDDEPSAPGDSPLTCDLSSPSTEESKRESGDLPAERLPLDDHLYYTNMAAPRPLPIIPCDRLDPLQALDPLSPAEVLGSGGSRRVLYCQLCPRVFFYLSDLERHAITHSQKKPHVCQQCGKAFKRSSHLQRHKHIHTGQRNFVCTICAKRFREAGELQRHQRVHTGEKPYQCQLCHTRFAERNTLRRHTKRKHPYHQVAMEMLNERRDGRGGGVPGAQEEEEESAEWYSSTVSNLENSESEVET